ncbi:MAG: type IX secretion system sortase PorU [Bacteroidota bacterium]
MVRTGFFLFFLAFASCPFWALAQRSYAAHSVLSSGNWFKLAVETEGIFKLDGARLQAAGIATLPISSTGIRLFGKGGGSLGESNSATYVDDLREIAIEVFDGGDGQFQANDYFLFYSPGPHSWRTDPTNQRFQFYKNLYSDTAFYYLSVSGIGKRVSTQSATGSGGVPIDKFLDRQVYELDSVNLLSSGKEWVGDELAQTPGKSLSKNSSFTFPNLLAGSPVYIQSRVLARSTGSGSRFDLKWNGTSIGQQQIPPIGTGLYDPFAISRTDLFSATAANATGTLTYDYQPGAFGAQGWIDRVEVFAERALSMNGIKSLCFRDLSTVGQSSVQFRLQAAPSDLIVWDVTDRFEPRRLVGDRNGNQYSIQVSATGLKEYVAFTGIDFPSPRVVGQLPSQDLHGLTATDMVVVVPNAWRTAADKLASLHRFRRNLRVQVVAMEQVREEFGGGVSDPTAIRDLMKMFYDRHRNNPVDRPKYLLLMGAGSYDPKGRIRNNDRPLPTFQSTESLDPLGTYCSDDFFGILDDSEDINNSSINNLLDVGIGRIPARSLSEAMAFVDKVDAYDDTTSKGSWRTRLTFVADDEDGNLHLSDAEGLSAVAKQLLPWMDQTKIYLDAFRQEAGAGGTRYPEANRALDREIFKGSLMINYSGHGGKDQLAEEVLVSKSTVDGWNNGGRLPLFIVATCDFAPYDNPAVRGLGEQLLVRPKTGGIALLSTARPVFAFSNRILNENYLKTALQPGIDGKYLSLGDAIRNAKNLTYQSSADLVNNRKFSLLGDPALTLAFPTDQVRTTRLNGQPLSAADTIKAGEQVQLEGEVTDGNGAIRSDFNGWVYPTVYDKYRIQSTLGNDPGSYPVAVEMPGVVLFSGVSTVTNGRFQYAFTAPLDMNPVIGRGRISYYARSANRDARGNNEELLLGDRVNGSLPDTEGPGIRLWLNEEGFADGGLSNPTPILLAELTDSSGINTAGGIGHDLIAQLSTQSTSSTLNSLPATFLLNDFYQAAPDTYKKGRIRFPIATLAPGSYTLKLRAWDVLNNASEKSLSFVVGEAEQLTIRRVLNYPNPFTSRTQFWFEHNAPGQLLRVSVEVMTLTGRVVRTLKGAFMTEGNFCRELEWDGHDDQGDRLGRGTYLYRIRVRREGGGQASELGKLVIL